MFTLPKLPYKYDALEPYIDEETMRIHHDKHHGAYVDNLNKALADHKQFLQKPTEVLLAEIDKVPSDIHQTVINNAGGHANHSFFWKLMAPPPTGGSSPQGALNDALVKTFGSFDKFKEEFSAKAMAVFGSGWAFLIKTPDGNLTLKRHSFQNSPLMHGNTPILGIDVWEHAYYLKYQNRKAEYVEAWWNVVNWKQVEKNFENAS